MNNNTLYEDNGAPEAVSVRQKETNIMLALFIIATISILFNCIQYEYRNTYFKDCNIECQALMKRAGCIAEFSGGVDYHEIRNYNYSAAVPGRIE